MAGIMSRCVVLVHELVHAVWGDPLALCHTICSVRGRAVALGLELGGSSTPRGHCWLDASSVWRHQFSIEVEFAQAVLLDVGHRRRAAALGNQRACTRLALAALGGHPQFELDVVKTHARSRGAGDAVFTDAVADTNNHGKNLGWRTIDR